MAKSYKARALADQLVDILKIRLSALTVTETFDTDGNPLISINDGTPATTEKNALIKVSPIDLPDAKDILGNAANVYTPHVIQLVTEAPAAGSGAGVYLDLPTLAPLLHELMAKRCRFEWYQSTNGSVPAASDIAAAKLKATVEPNLYFQGIANQ